MEMAQQYKELTFKEKWNICFAIMLWHQRCLVLGERRFWGSEALGKPCVFAVVLMLLWFLFSHDNGMLLWLAGFLVMLIVRRIEAVKVTRSGQVTSHYDGWPKTAMKFTKSEKIAKAIVEPILVGLLGLMVLWFYQENGWRPTGLPYFLLAGVFSLPFVAMVNQTIWERQIQSMQDAKITQQALMHEYRNKFGD
jgi:hypothetical protein